MSTREEQSLARRLRSLTRRARGLLELRKVLPLSRHADLTEEQWASIEASLSSTAERLVRPLQALGRAEPGPGGTHLQPHRVTATLGRAELALSRAYALFDTWMDVLTQRLSPTLGPLLKGCDALAHDGLALQHPALDLIAPPVVYCDRGFGASVLREGMRMPGGALTPMPLVQIPYARLQQKLNLTSLLHEVGHEAYVRLKVDGALGDAIEQAMQRHGASPTLTQLFLDWRVEIFCDFWAFGATGMAHAATMREVLALEPDMVTRITSGERHPTPYVRALLAFEWCRQAFGTGRWDRWDHDWRRTYAESEHAGSALIGQCTRAAPAISRMFFEHRFARLAHSPIASLFNLDAVAPARLQARLRGKGTRSPEFLAMRPCQQLAAFRLLHEFSSATEEQISHEMTRWLHRLASRHRSASRSTNSPSTENLTWLQTRRISLARS